MTGARSFLAMRVLNDISEAMQKGRAKLVKQLIPQASEEGLPA